MFERDEKLWKSVKEVKKEIFGQVRPSAANGRARQLPAEAAPVLVLIITLRADGQQTTGCQLRYFSRTDGWHTSSAKVLRT